MQRQVGGPQPALPKSLSPSPHPLPLPSYHPPHLPPTPQMSRMQRQVEDLQSALLKSLHDRSQPTVIVQGQGRTSG